MAEAFTALSNARTSADSDITGEANALAVQIEDFRTQLQAYQVRIAGQMALNGAVLQEEIDAAFALYDEMAAILRNDEQRDLLLVQADLAAWWDLHGADLEQAMSDVMDQIDAQAQLLEPMYAYGASSGSFGASNVEWTKIDTSFLSGVTGHDAGDLYFPYHNNASDIAQGISNTNLSDNDRNGVANQLFPWEGIAAAGYSEHSQLHPGAEGLQPNEIKSFGQHWIAETMGIYQTMIMRSYDPPYDTNDAWGNFPVSTVSQLAGFGTYATHDGYASPNAAGLWGGQYAGLGFLSGMSADHRAIAEDFYALAATMYFTGAYVDSPYNSFAHRDTDGNLRGGTGDDSITEHNNDRAAFGNYDETWPASASNYIDQVFQDPRVTQQGTFAPTDDPDDPIDVEPQHIGASPPSENETSGRVYSGVNLRSGPGLSYAVITELPGDASLTVLSTYGSEWLYVQSGDHQGWMSRGYFIPAQ